MINNSELHSIVHIWLLHIWMIKKTATA